MKVITLRVLSLPLYSYGYKLILLSAANGVFAALQFHPEFPLANA